MPELPEVETVVSDLKRKIVGKKITDVWSDWPKMLKNIDFSHFRKALLGKKISQVARRGKNIFIELDGNSTIAIHLKMTGHLLWRSGEYFKLKEKNIVKEDRKKPFREKVNQYIHFRFIFGAKRELAFSDVRKFGRIRFYKKAIADVVQLEEYRKLGFEPTGPDFTLENLKIIAAQRKNTNKEIKNFLLEQENISGIGNIYASEILFESGINPRKKVFELSDGELKIILSKTKEILQKAIAHRGTSISDFRDTAGRRGNFGKLRKVYQRKGEPCLNCKETIAAFKQGQRSTFYCPRCQQ